MSEKVLEFQIKAAYLVNIPNHITWPNSSFETPEDPFNYCLLDNGEISDTVIQTLSGKIVDGRNIIFHTEAPLLKQCHLIFISESKKDLLSRVFFATNERKNILAIGDFEEFAASGGMINFYNKDKRVKIAIDLTAILETDLQISSKLFKISNVTF